MSRPYVMTAMSESDRPLSVLDVLSILAIVLIWGLNFIVMKFGLEDFTPLQLGAARFLLSAVPLIFFVRPPKIAIRWIAAYGLVQGIGQFGFLFFALKVGMSAALASVLMQTQVFFTVLFGWFFLGERIGRALKIAMGFAVAGLACFAGDVFRDEGTGVVTAAGLALNLGAAAMWGCSNIVVKKIQREGRSFKPVSLIVWSSVVSGPAYVAMSFAFDPAGAHANWANASMAGWLSVVYLGWGANVIAYGLWTTLLNRHAANRVAPFSLGMPVVGLSAGMLILNEPVDALQWAGATLVMSALVFVFRRTADPGPD